MVAIHVRFSSIDLKALALSGYFQGFNYSRSLAWACVVSINTFMNLENRSLAGRRTRGGVEASGGVEALALSVLDLLLVNSSRCQEILARRLTRAFRRVVQNPWTIAKNRGLNVIFLNELANPLGMEFLEL